jgi:hypothetical protein
LDKVESEMDGAAVSLGEEVAHWEETHKEFTIMKYDRMIA